MARILVVDDEPLLAENLGMMLRRLGHDVLTAGTGELAVKVFRQERPHLTILDFELPDMNGLEVFKRIHTLIPQHPVVFLTGTGTEEVEIQARQMGAADFLLKGVTFVALKETVQRLVNGTQPVGDSIETP